MLKIENLHATVAGKPILNGLTLHVPAGEIHAIMGPNGAGKSTLAYVLGGRPGYEVTSGSVEMNGVDLFALEPHERAAAGMFLGFQYPVEIPGVSYLQFLRESLNSQRRGRDQAELSGAEFIRLAKAQAATLGMDAEMLKRPVNVGFSGGEKKRAEMVQMGIMAPRLAILDETDSGLDIDALKAVGAGINSIMRAPDKAVLLITHYQRLLDYVRPDRVHVLSAGRITRSGGPELAHDLEREGLWRDGGMNALPSRADEAFRYADVAALASVWDDLAQPEFFEIAAQQKVQQIWLSTADPIQVRRMEFRLHEGASMNIFALNAAATYGRIEIEVTLADGAHFGLDAANIGCGQSTMEIVTTVRHVGVAATSRQAIRSVLGGAATGSYLGKVAVARTGQQTDSVQSVKAMLLDRGATANAKPELEIYADDVKCAHGATVGELDRDQLFYAAARGLDPASARALLLDAFVGELWDGIEGDDMGIAEAARTAVRTLA